MSLFLFRLRIPCAFQILTSVYFTSGSSLFFHILSSTVFILNNETRLMLFVCLCWDIFNTRLFLLYSALSILAEYESYFSLASQRVSSMHKTPFEVKGSFPLQWSFLSRMPKMSRSLPNSWIEGLCCLCVWQDSISTFLPECRAVSGPTSPCFLNIKWMDECETIRKHIKLKVKQKPSHFPVVPKAGCLRSITEAFSKKK